jgi:hypothetical protein
MMFCIAELNVLEFSMLVAYFMLFTKSDKSFFNTYGLKLIHTINGYMRMYTKVCFYRKA